MMSVPGSWGAVVQFAGEGHDFINSTFGGLEIVLVGSEAVLLPLLAVASLPPVTKAVFVKLSGAVIETLTLKLKILVPEVAIAFELRQVMICPDALQVQLAALVPLKLTAPDGMLNPVGKVSVTVIIPEVEAVPPLETVKV